LRAKERKVDHCGNDRVGIAKAQRYGAEGEAVQEIDRAVDRIEHPQQLVAGRIAAFLLAQKSNLRRLVMQEVTDEAFDGQVYF
jgi:hypothetical protein